MKMVLGDRVFFAT